MQNVTIEAFNIIGLSVRTTNKNGQAAKDIPDLWHQFISRNMIDKIPNKIDHTLYALYTAYEGDHTQPYTTIIGCKVKHLKTIPNGLVGQLYSGGNYMKITTKGDLTKGLIINEWTKIWNTNLNRAYTTDFEVYGEKAQNPNNAEVDILIALK